MRYRKLLVLIVSSFLLSACSTSSSESNSQNYKISNPTVAAQKPTQVTVTPGSSEELLKIKPNQKMFATIKTNKGNIRIELFANKAPKTVANFVGLSEGTQDWINPKTGEKVSGTPLYNNVIFHRVISDFMIQGGDPMGTGMGGPGYRFADEPVTEKYTRGTLAMANSGPNTNGSQFFIVHKDYPLPPNYTIFGRIPADETESFATLDAIATTPTNPSDRPTTDIVISSIEIERP